MAWHIKIVSILRVFSSIDHQFGNFNQHLSIAGEKRIFCEDSFNMIERIDLSVMSTVLEIKQNQQWKKVYHWWRHILTSWTHRNHQARRTAYLCYQKNPRYLLAFLHFHVWKRQQSMETKAAIYSNYGVKLERSLSSYLGISSNSKVVLWTVHRWYTGGFVGNYLNFPLKISKLSDLV